MHRLYRVTYQLPGNNAVRDILFSYNPIYRLNIPEQNDGPASLYASAA